MSKGCTVALIAAGVIVLAVIIFGVYICSNPEKIVNLLMDQVEKEVIANLPDGYTAESVHQTVADFKDGFKKGTIDPKQLTTFSTAFQNAYADRKLDKEESKKLMEELERALGRLPAVDSTGVPTPVDSAGHPADTLK